MMPGPATEALLLLTYHVPPGIASVRVMPEPTHTMLPPDIVPDTAAGAIVITSTAKAVPQPVVTV